MIQTAYMMFLVHRPQASLTFLLKARRRWRNCRLRCGCVSTAISSCLLLVWTGFQPAHADPVLDWNALMIDAVRIDNSGPTLSSRNLAILHCAIHDAVNSVDGRHQPYRIRAHPLTPTSAEAAAVAAAFVVTSELYPSLRGRSQAQYDQWLAGSARDAATTNGLALGNSVGNLMLQERSNDGSSTEVPYIPSNAPGQWRRTPPFFRPPFTPHWRNVTPFAIPTLEQFSSPPPPALSSSAYATALNEVQALGGKVSALRGARNSETAVFWSDFSYTSMPPGHWHLIAEGIAVSQTNSLPDNARLFALLSLAQADTAIVCWEAKFRYNLWRPVTAIQRADEDSNPLTHADPTWDHFLGSPPFPAYFSGHSSFSAASAVVLAEFYGRDDLSFQASSDSLPGVIRSYTSLAACADEVGLSRIYGGIHYSFDNTEGKEVGRKVGNHVSSHFLLPLSTLPSVRVDQVRPGTVELTIQGRGTGRLELQTSEDLKAFVPAEFLIVRTRGLAIHGYKRKFEFQVLPCDGDPVDLHDLPAWTGSIWPCKRTGFPPRVAKDIRCRCLRSPKETHPQGCAFRSVLQ